MYGSQFFFCFFDKTVPQERSVSLCFSAWKLRDARESCRRETMEWGSSGKGVAKPCSWITPGPCDNFTIRAVVWFHLEWHKFSSLLFDNFAMRGWSRCLLQLAWITNHREFRFWYQTVFTKWFWENLSAWALLGVVPDQQKIICTQAPVHMLNPEGTQNTLN